MDQWIGPLVPWSLGPLVHWSIVGIIGVTKKWTPSTETLQCTLKLTARISSLVTFLYTEDQPINSKQWFNAIHCNDDILVAMWIHQCMGRFAVNGIWISIDMDTCRINFKQSPKKFANLCISIDFAECGQSEHCFHLNREGFHSYRDFSATLVDAASTSCSSIQRASILLHHRVVNMFWWRYKPN